VGGFNHSPSSYIFNSEAQRFRKLNLNSLNDYTLGPITGESLTRQGAAKNMRLLSLSEIKASRELSLSIVDQSAEKASSKRYTLKSRVDDDDRSSIERKRFLRRPVRKFETSLTN
jgi:hypothetical protein